MSNPEPTRFTDLEKRIIVCERCPRLVKYRRQVAKERRKEFRDWIYWGRPVPGFGSDHAKLLILGLAPAAHGGNRTGRVFTGDPSAQFLFQHLHAAGFSNHPYSKFREDGLKLTDTYVTAVVKCVPPENRPTSEERANCSEYLAEEIRLQTSLRVVLALGGFAFDAYRRFLDESFKIADSWVEVSAWSSLQVREWVSQLVCIVSSKPAQYEYWQVDLSYVPKGLEEYSVGTEIALKAKNYL